MIVWKWYSFSDFSTEELYDVLALRARVFVIEQRCIYEDADGKDKSSYHLCGWEKDEVTQKMQLTATLRVLPPGLKGPTVTIGRVVTAPDYRGTGLGRKLFDEGIAGAEKRFGKVPITISAQQRLEKFYASFGFRTQGETYLEDQIPHIRMTFNTSDQNSI